MNNQIESEAQAWVNVIDALGAYIDVVDPPRHRETREAWAKDIGYWVTAVVEGILDGEA